MGNLTDNRYCMHLSLHVYGTIIITVQGDLALVPILQIMRNRSLERVNLGSSVLRLTGRPYPGNHRL